MRIINDCFPKARAFPTEKKARAHLMKFEDALPEDPVVAIIPRASDEWLVVLVLRHRDVVNIPYLAGNGICLTN